MIPVQNILCIDDEEVWQDTVCEAFEPYFDVVATDDDNFNTEIEGKIYELIILDISMPNKNGIEVFEEIRKINRRAVIIVLTSLTKDTNEVKYFMDHEIKVFYKSNTSFDDEILEYIKKYSFKELKDMKVLIVDDEDDQRSTYKDLIISEGFKTENITCCRSIEETESLISLKCFDIYLIDLCYLINGEQVCKGDQFIVDLIQKGFDKSSILVLLTSKCTFQDRLEKLNNRIDLHPLFYDSDPNFLNEIHKLAMRGPFGVLNG